MDKWKIIIKLIYFLENSQWKPSISYFFRWCHAVYLTYEQYLCILNFIYITTFCYPIISQMLNYTDTACGSLESNVICWKLMFFFKYSIIIILNIVECHGCWECKNLEVLMPNKVICLITFKRYFVKRILWYTWNLKYKSTIHKSNKNVTLKKVKCKRIPLRISNIF